MHKDKSIKEINRMSPNDRWHLAREKLCNEDHMGTVPTLSNHMRVHENTKWLLYSSSLSDQIPESYAAHSFRELQRSMLHYEIIRLCSFWDPIDLHSRSIPTIVALADSPGVSQCVFEDHASHFQKTNNHLAETQAKEAQSLLCSGISNAKEIEESDVLSNVRNFRDKLAHQLERTNKEMKSPGKLQSPSFGDETELLNQTVKAVNELYISLNGVSFDWEGAEQMHKRNAEAFWGGVTIKVLR